MIEQIITQIVGNSPYAFALYTVWAKLDKRITLVEKNLKRLDPHA